MSTIMDTLMSTITVEPNPESMRNAFVTFYNEYVADSDVPTITEDEVYVVWFCYIVGNAKALISTTRPDHMYYELTYHLDKNQLHVDAYMKVIHKSLDII